MWFITSQLLLVQFRGIAVFVTRGVNTWVRIAGTNFEVKYLVKSGASASHLVTMLCIRSSKVKLLSVLVSPSDPNKAVTARYRKWLLLPCNV